MSVNRVIDDFRGSIDLSFMLAKAHTQVECHVAANEALEARKRLKIKIAALVAPNRPSLQTSSSTKLCFGEADTSPQLLKEQFHREKKSRDLLQRARAKTE